MRGFRNREAGGGVRRRAFTLIELLIVVAIIGILAAIAVPNFLEAQTRSKVARAQSELRTLVTGLEAYHVDNNAYPYVTDDDSGEWLMPAGYPVNRTGPGGLTTPVAYISAAIFDPFVLDTREAPAGGRLPEGMQYLHYERCGFGYDGAGQPFNDDGQMVRAVHVPVDANGTLNGTYPDPDTTDRSKVPTEYVVYSVGPDRTHRVYNEDETVLLKSRWSILNRYDPTNGTISTGNIVRYSNGVSFP